MVPVTPRRSRGASPVRQTQRGSGGFVFFPFICEGEDSDASRAKEATDTVEIEIYSGRTTQVGLCHLSPEAGSNHMALPIGGYGTQRRSVLEETPLDSSADYLDYRPLHTLPLHSILIMWISEF
ncbi:hypothetical protein H6P81_006552 [Aristolochia fimbriata]|uniref:Uncharacterized protein n=1 Tax=Aristolochia fimbriata TaxID=158543 RepID=A0AAV7F253_ARIFI|nr:hypothetical protein H6P81_006552 [Aristolochia fimbriata]